MCFLFCHGGAVLRRCRQSSFARPGLRRQCTGISAAWWWRSRSATTWPSARALNAPLLKVLDEEQIYRIDHFLGKETVQNIMALRFANGLFEPIWNRDHIDHVQITAAETVGVEQRGKFYEATGALRDMVPNHMFQLLSHDGDGAADSFDAEAVRSEKGRVFQAIHPLTGATRCRTWCAGSITPGAMGTRTCPAIGRSPMSRQFQHRDLCRDEARHR